jgi:hypothetical protein
MSARGWRVRLLELSHEEILFLAQHRPPHVLPVLPDLPEDATSRGAILSGEVESTDGLVVAPALSLVLLVHSHTYPLVPRGIDVPFLQRRQPAQPEPEEWDE